jgi:hypothetical protein
VPVEVDPRIRTTRNEGFTLRMSNPSGATLKVVS